MTDELRVAIFGTDDWPDPDGVLVRTDSGEWTWSDPRVEAVAREYASLEGEDLERLMDDPDELDCEWIAQFVHGAVKLLDAAGIAFTYSEVAKRKDAQ